MDDDTKNIVAVLACFFVPGLGQAIKGDFARGIFFFIAAFVALILCLILIGFILYPIVWLASMWDAYKLVPKSAVVAKKK